MKILVMNAGSISQKCALYQVTMDVRPFHPPMPRWDWVYQPGIAKGHPQAQLASA